MKLTDFATLPLAQAHAETSTKMITPDMMLAFLTTFDLVDILDTVAENPSTPVTKEAKAIRKAFAFGSEFNFINNHPANIQALLANMATDSVVTQPFADYCIAYANPVKKPFENSTQADWDAQVALDLVSGSVDAHTIKYGESINDYVIKRNGVDLKFFVVFDTPPPVDCTVDIFVWEQASESLPHSKFPQAINIMRVKSGDVSTSDLCTKNLKRKIKFSATCNYNLPFTLHVND